VWALGAILYKMLTGRAAFAAQTASASLAKIVADAPPPLRAARPDAPPELEALILRCLEKDVSRRVQSAGELARALAPYLPGNMRTRAGETMDTTVPGASYPNPQEEMPRHRRRGVAVLVACLVTLVLTAGLALLVLIRQPSRAAPVGAASSALPAPPEAPASAALTPPAAPTPAAPSATAPASASAPTSLTSASAAPSDAPTGPRRPNPPRGGSSDAFSDRL
jgi:serine/threonine-protein kinase